MSIGEEARTDIYTVQLEKTSFAHFFKPKIQMYFSELAKQ